MKNMVNVEWENKNLRTKRAIMHQNTNFNTKAMTFNGNQISLDETEIQSNKLSTRVGNKKIILEITIQHCNYVIWGSSLSGIFEQDMR